MNLETKTKQQKLLNVSINCSRKIKKKLSVKPDKRTTIGQL